MHRAGYSSAADSESLQTDVMRFMAIIAFCLIAILALVRNVEPSAVKEPSATKEPSAEKEPSKTFEPPTPAEAHATAPAPEVPAEIPEAVEAPPLKALEPIRPLPDDQPLPRTLRKTNTIAAAPPEVEEKTRAATADVPTEITAAPPAVEKPPAGKNDEEGLSLRFASDRDFMRLVAKGDIQVYALKAQDVLSLDRTFRFLESPAPDRIYELLPETIPRLMANALNSERTETGDYVWGIRMPDRLEKRIRAFIDKGATGQLIINRYGEVQHAAGA